MGDRNRKHVLPAPESIDPVGGLREGLPEMSDTEPFASGKGWFHHSGKGLATYHLTASQGEG